MRATVGVDSNGLYRGGLHLYSRLRFKLPFAKLVHAVELVPAAIDPINSAAIAGEYVEFVESMQANAASVLSEAEREAEAYGIPADTDARQGTAGKALIEAAEADDADLVVVGSQQKGKFGSLFFGSVTRALTIGAHQSVLIGKGEVAESGPLTAVLATDQSEYASACMQMLIGFAPKGFELVTIVTAHDTDYSELQYSVDDDEAKAKSLIEQIELRMQASNEVLAEQLETLGTETDVRIHHGSAEEAMAKEMERTGADLLIVGARGHGFLERVMIGSTAMHAVINTPYSVLVLRA